jgi:hypothetical protein
MRRINPKTLLEFKHGDIREDGMIFYGYKNTRPIKKNGFVAENWLSPDVFNKRNEQKKKTTTAWTNNKLNTKDGHILFLWYSVLSRSKLNNIPFNLTQEYLRDIAVDKCPVFGFDLAWGSRNKLPKDNSPSLDRIDPTKGYVIGNVRWLSQLANRMKNSATDQQLLQFANWVLTTGEKYD